MRITPIAIGRPIKNCKYLHMRTHLINKNTFFSDNEDIELFANFPWKNMRMIETLNLKKEPAMSNKSQLKTKASKIKAIAGVCFITDVKGFFKYIHPNFLKLFEGVEHQFFERSIFDTKKQGDMPPTIDYLVEMIQEKRKSVFIGNLCKNKQNALSKLQWNISYYGGLLNFNLFEQPVSPEKEAISLKSKPSKRKALISEIENMYKNIEQARTYHNGIIYPDNNLLH